MTHLDDIRARAEAATEGPWKLDHVASDDDGWLYAHLNHDLKFRDGTVWKDQSLATVESGEADAAFIAHARTDIPKLLAALDAVREHLRISMHANDALVDEIEEIITEDLS